MAGVLRTSRNRASLAFPALLVRLYLPSAGRITFQHLYGIVTHPLAQPNLLNWLLNSIYMLVGCWFVSERLNDRQQWTIVLAALVIGAIGFEVLGKGEAFVGSGMLAYGVVGSVAVYGLWGWRTLHLGWRMFVVFSIITLVGVLVQRTASGQCFFVAAALGGSLTARWVNRQVI
jgi:hypothetical protein